MCGICGYIHFRELNMQVLKNMNQTIHYRGPDDEGYYLDYLRDGRQIGMAQRRLSVLDLSADGHQPMSTSDGNITVVFNGEIYNFLSLKKQLQDMGYCFSSNTDTEIILYAYQQWGIDCVKQFNGMFAFALFDKRSDEVYLVRDRLGIKPLYYYSDGAGVVFASELKPILQYPYFNKDIEMGSLKLYLYRQYITGPATIYKNVFKLEPGYILKLSGKSQTLICYWSVEDVYRNRNIYEGSFADAGRDLKKLLSDAVRLRMISDVPLGGFLSGGIDSSLVVSVMQEQSSRPVKTFTVGFYEEQYNEAPYAKEVAQYLGTDHYEEYISIEDAKKYIADIPLYYDEPMADASQIATMLLSKITKKHVTVSLSGDGGDELFCGYDRYSNYLEYRKYMPVSRLLSCLAQIIPLKALFKEMGWRRLQKLIHLSSVDETINSNYLAYWDMHTGLVAGNEDMHKYMNILKLDDNIQVKFMLQDLKTFLPDDILTKVDRASMSVSLEVRVPLLDYRIVEFALSLPHNYRYYKGEGKRVMRELLYQYVPQKLVDRPKKGFCVPVGRWIREDYKNFAQDYFDEDYIRRQGLFDCKEISRIVHNFRLGNDEQSTREFWSLYVFQRWYEQYIR